MQENTISVCYSGNKRVFPGLLLSVLSLAKFTDRPLRVYALTMDLHEVDPAFIPFSDEQIAVLDAVLKEKNPESAAMRIDVSDKFRAELADGKNTENFYTPYTLLRLYMDGFEMFPDKIVYLDIDTMCASDIGQLYDVDLGDAEYGAVLDHMGKFWINRHYCNAGVLLFGSLSASTYIGITFSSWLMGLMTAYAETPTIPLLSAMIPAKSAVEMGMRSTFFVVGIIVLLMLACLLLTFAAIKQKNTKSESECRLLQQESIYSSAQIRRTKQIL